MGNQTTYRVTVRTLGVQTFVVHAKSEDSAIAEVRARWYLGEMVDDAREADWPTAKAEETTDE